MRATATKSKNFPYHQYRGTYQILGGLTIAIVGLWVGFILVGTEHTTLEGNALAYWTNVLTEILGVMVTIAFINQFAIIRERSKLKKQLIRQAASPSQSVATEAIAQLREEGWLTGENGLLAGENLRGANLSGANLANANLQGTSFYQANLSHAILEDANLSTADMRDCNLEHVRMSSAQCVGTNFENAQMSGATAWYVDFTDANLRAVNLVNASIPQSNFTRASLEMADVSGSHMKNAKLFETNISGTHFEGCDMLGVQLQNPQGGLTVRMMPDSRVYLTVLPDGLAMVFEEDIESYITMLKSTGTAVPYEHFVFVEHIDFTQFTNTQHPAYKNWRFEWLKRQPTTS